MFKPFGNSWEKENRAMSHGRILFVDDDQDIAGVSKRVLESAGYRVTIQNNAEEALRLFAGKPYDFDLIVTDFMMPDMNGVELSDRIFTIRADIPVILSTGYAEDALDKSTLPKGISGILFKPANMSEIREAIRHAIGRVC
jgi:CheY-like chemotaxis protein